VMAYPTGQRHRALRPGRRGQPGVCLEGAAAVPEATTRTGRRRLDRLFDGTSRILQPMSPPPYPTRDPAEALERHHHSFFAGHDLAAERWSLGPWHDRVPELFVHEVAPGPRIGAWTYLTIGVWPAAHSDTGHGLEFLITAPEADTRLVELLTIVAYYHAGPESQRLDIGHTVPIGAPWLQESACNHLLVGLPYAYGPELEHCSWEGGHARLLALVPITEEEHAYKVHHGADALEARLEEAAAVVVDPARPSAV
jgi:hypothetical protein